MSSGKLTWVLAWLAASAVAAERPRGFRAGAARLDITPPADAALPMSGYSSAKSYRSIHDHLFVRAVVFDDGRRQAAFVACDLSAIGHSFWKEMSERWPAETGIPADHIILAATHTHGGPALGDLTDDDGGESKGAYPDLLKQRIVEAVRQAKGSLEPARVGAAEGRANVNISRRARMAEGDWWIGRNPDGASDKTVSVIKVESRSGRPIAILINYAVHGVVMGAKNSALTADLPGATSRWVEEHYRNEVVAPWTSGAAGDQNPIYGPGEEFDKVAVLGQILGEEAVRVAEGIVAEANLSLHAGQKVVTCPGQDIPPGPRRRKDRKYQFLDAPPTPIRLSVLTMGGIALAGVSGEPLTMIGQRLKKESPYAHTVMVAHANGSSRYLPDDAAYQQLSYEVVSSKVKAGCAENAIVGGILALMQPFQRDDGHRQSTRAQRGTRRRPAR